MRGDSVTMDFIGPLRAENGFECILTMTDASGVLYEKNRGKFGSIVFRQMAL